MCIIPFIVKKKKYSFVQTFVQLLNVHWEWPQISQVVNFFSEDSLEVFRNGMDLWKIRSDTSGLEFEDC